MLSVGFSQGPELLIRQEGIFLCLRDTMQEENGKTLIRS
jgi:hypothetical protein